MKTFIAIIVILSASFSHARTEIICSAYYSKKVIPVATEHSKNDKNRHCTVSCMLTLRCIPEDVMMAGMLKELKDLFGPGNAEVEDLKADVFGIELAAMGAAKTDQQCLETCDLYYSP